MIFLRQFQAGTVAGGQQFPVPTGEPAAHDRPNGVQDIAAGQVESRRDLRLAGSFFMPLLFHQFGAGQPELDTCKGVDGVCYPYLDYTFEVYGYLSKTQVTDTLRQKNRRTYPLVSLSQKCDISARCRNLNNDTFNHSIKQGQFFFISTGLDKSRKAENDFFDFTLPFSRFAFRRFCVLKPNDQVPGFRKFF